jgi:hypothetical protein
MTAGSMTRSFLNHLPQLLGSDRRNLFALLQAPIALLGGFFQGGHLLWYSAVLPLGVIRGLDVNLAERHDVGPANDADILTPCRGRQPAAQVFLRVRNRESLHIAFISPSYKLVNSRIAIRQGSKSL